MEEAPENRHNGFRNESDEYFREREIRGVLNDSKVGGLKKAIELGLVEEGKVRVNGLGNSSDIYEVTVGKDNHGRPTIIVEEVSFMHDRIYHKRIED